MRRARLTLQALIFLLPFALTAAVAPAQAAPASPGASCLTSQLSLAPALATDRNPNGTPVSIRPDGRGKYTPIIMVHGWTGADVHNDARKGNFSHKIDLTANRVASVSTDRSLIGQFQRIPGALVFTFDYRDYSARWVDDQHIGPALGSAIDCLHKQTGEKVILVGHSMGGLAARYAVTHPGAAGIDRAQEVSTVVTFGTPELGSLIALLANGGLNAATAAGLEHGDLLLPLIRLFLAECGHAVTATLETGTICDFLPAPARSFDSAAGRALRYGSPELAALKPWPKAITVDALAGQATFNIPRAGFFALPWQTTSVPAGDLIVTAGSALSGATLTKQITCSYQLSAIRGGTDNLGLALGFVSKTDVAQQPLAAFNGACFHTDLMRAIELTNEAVGAVANDISSRQLTALPPLADASGMCDLDKFPRWQVPGWNNAALTGVMRVYGADVATGSIDLYLTTPDSGKPLVLRIRNRAIVQSVSGTAVQDAARALAHEYSGARTASLVETRFRGMSDANIYIFEECRLASDPYWTPPPPNQIPGLSQFKTPTGNIQCYINFESDARYDEARCDVTQIDWKLPPRPASCEYDWGPVLVVRGLSGSAFSCVSDSASNEHVVPYGTIITRGPFSCDVEQSGVTCTDGVSGHGFAVSRKAYRLF